MSFPCRIACLLLNAFAVFPLFSQDLYLPRNIRQAYDRQTRSSDGRPGPRYWQNRAVYHIDVSVDLPSRVLTGTADIQYFNYSPDTLRMIRIKLAHDLWRSNGQRNYDLPPEDIGEGVKIRQVRVAGAVVASGSLRQGNTFLDISLTQALAPLTMLEIAVDWSHVAPSAHWTPRECVCDSTTWFNAYWYPQVAVYDDLHGWADFPYNGLQEMYNDFSDYEVRISVPGNSMVWATGVWQNAENLLEPEFYRRYRQAQEATEVVRIFSPEDYAAQKAFFKPEPTHTFIYKAENVPDFAFGFSDHYLWDATSMTPEAGRRTLVSAAYNPKSKDYYEVCSAASRGLQLMSSWLPGYPYPYPRMTVFNGDDGMEFPMMCNDASTSPNSPIGLTVHESSHSYFPFMMGINEQYYAWMDEGWASFFDIFVTDSIAGKSLGRLRDYADAAGTDQDMPPMTPSRHLNVPAYRVASYNRPQAAYLALYEMLGYERFHRCMVEYMNRWKGKHPQPFDFFNTWNDASGENLNWFWKPWFFDWGFPDLAVAGIDGRGVLIENRGTMPMAVAGAIEYTDGSREAFRRSPAVWKKGKKSVYIPVEKGKTVKKVTLADPLVSDAVQDNNLWVRDRTAQELPDKRQ